MFPDQPNAIAGPSRLPPSSYATSSSERPNLPVPLKAMNTTRPNRSVSLTERVRRVSNRDYSPTSPNHADAFHSLPSPIAKSEPSSSRSRSQTRPKLPEPPPPQPPPKDITIDPVQAALLHSARMAVSNIDREAMRKLRSTMKEGSEEGGSSNSHGKGNGSPSSLVFPGGSVGPGGSLGRQAVRSRRSTLSRQVSSGPNLNEIGRDGEDWMTSGGETPALERPRDDYFTTIPIVTTPDYVIAVVGHPNVGKSTFINRALKPWGSSPPTKSETFKGHTVSSCFSSIQTGSKTKNASKIEFLEMNLDALDMSGVGEDIWPEGVPHVQGVVLCYDATRRDSIAGLPETISRLTANGTTTVIMALQSDPDVKLDVEATEGNALGEPHNVGLIEVTALTPEGRGKMRSGLQWLILKLEQRMRRSQRKTSSSGSPPRHSASQSTTGIIPERGEPTKSPTNSRHLELVAADSDTSSSADRVMWHRRSRTNGNNPDETAIGGESDTKSSSSSLQWMMKGPIQNGSFPMPPEAASKTISNDLEEAKEAEATVDAVVPPNPPASEPVPYLSLQTLINRVLSAILSSDDIPFVKAFFLTYRRFYRPRELAGEFLHRMQAIEGYDITKDIKHWSLMRLTGALIDWTNRYPGDFAELETQSTFREILQLALRYPFMAHLTTDLVIFEQRLANNDITDVDQSWSLRTDGAPSTTAASLSSRSVTELVIDGEVLYDLDSSHGRSTTSLQKDKPPSTRSISISSLGPGAPQSGLARHRSASDGRRNSPGSEEGRFNLAHDEAGFIKWKYAWEYVMGMDVRGMAVELTKMQWGLFAAIRPRDVFRHDFGRETDDPVGRAVTFFNRMSRWVSTMILANPKPKHRARTYEKFVHLAHQLRRLNSYDTLYALISGMQEISIHRLAATHALVQIPPALDREWQGHLKLMDPRGGYVHYRRAIQADITNGRPAIPLLTSILSLVNRLQSVKREDIRDGQVNWDKFAKFGEILAIIPDCQARGAVVPGQASLQFRKIVEDTPVIDHEDALFERSKMLEPGGGVQGGRVMRRFANLGF